MRTHSYLSIAGSLLLAGIVWLAVTLNKTYTTQLRVPLAVVNLPQDVAIASSLPAHVDVTLEGRGWQLLILATVRPLVFEIPGPRLASSRRLQLSRYLEDALRLPEGVTARLVAPDTIDITIDRYVRKKVPVRLAAEALLFRQDFGLAGPISVLPDSVELFGADKVLRGIDSWPTEPRRYEDLSNPVVDELALADSLPGIVRFKSEPVKVFIPVEQLADVLYEGIAVSVTDAPRDRHILLANPFVGIHVRGGVNRLATLEAQDFTVTISYGTLAQDTTGAVTPDVHLPDGVTLLRVTPPRIRYTVRQ